MTRVIAKSHRSSVCVPNAALSAEDQELLPGQLIDRFGLLPDAARNLLDIARLRQQAQKLGIRKLEGNEKGGVI